MVFDLKALRPSVITPIRILGLYIHPKGWVVLITPIRILGLSAVPSAFRTVQVASYRAGPWLKCKLQVVQVTVVTVNSYSSTVNSYSSSSKKNRAREKMFTGELSAKRTTSGFSV